MLEIGIQSAHWYKSTDPTGSFRFIKECGFEAVDFNMDQYINVKKAAAEGIYPTIFDGDTAEVLEFFKPLKEASEETGVISIAREGKLIRYIDSRSLKDTLESLYSTEKEHRFIFFKRRNVDEK